MEAIWFYVVAMVALLMGFLFSSYLVKAVGARCQYEDKGKMRALLVVFICSCILWSVGSASAALFVMDGFLKGWLG